jgi:hypothetical protein
MVIALNKPPIVTISEDQTANRRENGTIVPAGGDINA